MELDLFFPFRYDPWALSGRSVGIQDKEPYKEQESQIWMSYEAPRGAEQSVLRVRYRAPNPTTK